MTDKGLNASCGTSKCDWGKNLVCSFGLKRDHFNREINEGVCVHKGKTRIYGELCNETAECTKEWKCRVPPLEKKHKQFSFQAPDVEVMVCGECLGDDDCPGHCEQGLSSKWICKDGQRLAKDRVLKKCILPFIWSNMVFDAPTSIRAPLGHEWCPTTVDEEFRFPVEGKDDDWIYTKKHGKSVM